MSASLNFYSQNVSMDRILRENLKPQAIPFQVPDADIEFKNSRTNIQKNFSMHDNYKFVSFRITYGKEKSWGNPSSDSSATFQKITFSNKGQAEIDFPNGDINLNSANPNINYPKAPYSPQQWQADISYPRGGVNIYGQNSSLNQRSGFEYPDGASNPIPTGSTGLNPVGVGEFSNFIYKNKPAGSGSVNPSGYTIKNTGVGNPIANLIYKTSANAPLSQNTGLNNGSTGSLIPQASNGSVGNTGSSAINSGTPAEQVSSDNQQPNQSPKNVYVYGNINHNNNNDFYGDFRNNKYNFNGILDKLSPEVKDIAEKYGTTMAGKSLIIDENGGLVGVYNTSDLQNLTGTKMGETDPVNYHGKGTAIGKEITLPDGNKVKIINNAYASPLAFDINGDGIKTTKSKVIYDIDGDGKKDKINDVKDGILCVNGGKDGKDLFGDNTDIDRDGKADGKNGFESLKALALKEGLVNGDDDMKLDKADIKKLQKKYGLGIKQGYKGKVKSLEDVGIDEINLARIKKTLMNDNFDRKGNKLMTQQGATFRVNGKEREYADVWHKKYD